MRLLSLEADMRRRDFLGVLGVAAAAWPVAVRAQQTSLPRVGWLVVGNPVSYRRSLAAFLEGLRVADYIEGRNILIEYRWAEGNVARLSVLARELVQQK